MEIWRRLRRRRNRRLMAQSEWAFLFEPYHGDEVVSLDLETTSLTVKEAQILSIGAVKIRGRRILTSECFDIKLKKPPGMTAESIKIHHILQSELENGMELEPALKDLLLFIGNRPLLGYYVNYDIRVLDRFIEPLFGFRLPNSAIELSQVYNQIIKWRYLGGEIDLRFDTIARKLDIPMFERHTALGDAVTVALMYIRLRHGEML